MTSETLPKADVFSLGVMMYQICSGRNIRESGENGLYRKLREGRAEPILGLAPGLNGLIQKCLHPDHTRRPSARDILADKVLLQVSVSEKKYRAQLAQKDAALSAAHATIAQLRGASEVELTKENSRPVTSRPVTSRPVTKLASNNKSAPVVPSSTRFSGSAGFAQPQERLQGSRRSPRADTARSPRAGTSRGKRIVQGVQAALTANN